MAAAVVEMAKSPIPLVLASHGVAKGRYMPEPLTTPAHVAAEKVRDPKQRERLQKAAGWAVGRSNTEINEIERGIADAVAQRVQRR